MALTGEEIRSRLGDFAAKWSVYEGTERSEAQTFLNQLFACYGTDREAVATRTHKPLDADYVRRIQAARRTAEARRRLLSG